jgi:hypothetical protein
LHLFRISGANPPTSSLRERDPDARRLSDHLVGHRVIEDHRNEAVDVPHIAGGEVCGELVNEGSHVRG